jgi:hypothetical protein
MTRKRALIVGESNSTEPAECQGKPQPQRHLKGARIALLPESPNPSKSDPFRSSKTRSRAESEGTRATRSLAARPGILAVSAITEVPATLKVISNLTCDHDHGRKFINLLKRIREHVRRFANLLKRSCEHGTRFDSQKFAARKEDGDLSQRSWITEIPQPPCVIPSTDGDPRNP